VLVRKGKITQELITLMASWRHSGFNVHCSTKIQTDNEVAMENLARHIVQASFSLERMAYFSESKVLYRSKDGEKEKPFEAIETLLMTALCESSSCHKILGPPHAVLRCRYLDTFNGPPADLGYLVSS
jgi:Putative transposase